MGSPYIILRNTYPTKHQELQFVLSSSPIIKYKYDTHGRFVHYENMPMQYTETFSALKTEYFITLLYF